MILGGDELGRTQGGNNNAYCQDNATSWVDWAAAETHADLTAFTRRLCALRAAHPVFRRRQFLRAGGTTSRGSGPTAGPWPATTGRRRGRAPWPRS